MSEQVIAPRRYVHPLDFAAELGIGKTMIYRLLKQGLPAIRVGKLRRVIVDQAYEWLKASATSATRQPSSAPARSKTGPKPNRRV